MIFTNFKNKNKIALFTNILLFIHYNSKNILLFSFFDKSFLFLFYFYNYNIYQKNY